jgi:hypothetical protein
MHSNSSSHPLSFLYWISLFVLGSNAWAAVFTVTNTNATGPGSLAQAITDANNLAGADTIPFDVPGAGVHTITVTGDGLPVIIDDVTIDGYTQPGATENTLSVGDNAVILIQIDGGGPASAAGGLAFGNGTSIVRGLSLTGFSLIPNAAAISSGSGLLLPVATTIEGNFIGITPDGSVRGNQVGVEANDNDVVGGATPEKRNIISGNEVGISGSPTVLGNYIGTDPSGLKEGFGNVIAIRNALIVGGTETGAANVITGNYVGISASSDAIIQGNLIGPFADGSPAFGNQIGIQIAGAQNQIGGLGPNEGNVIAYNYTAVSVLAPSITLPSTSGNSILSNSIFANRVFGIDLNEDGVTHNDFEDGDTGANLLQNFPIISAVTRDATSTIVTGGLNSAPSTAFTLQFFAGPVEVTTMGQTLLGTKTVATNSNGDALFEFTFPIVTTGDQVITATATDPDGNTSEFSPQDSKSELVNLSTRGNVGTGDNVLIGGFIVRTSTSRTLLIRALGPSLPVNGALADPKLTLISPNGGLFLPLENDNWRDPITQEQAILATGLAPGDDRESAILVTVQPNPVTNQPGEYTAIVSGADGGNGIASIEIYDLDPFDVSTSNPVDLANLSTRGNVGTGDDVLIGGIILRGDAPQRLIVRAIGPDLADAGVAGVLQDPMLELHDSDGNLFASNDDWRSDQEAEIIATGLAPNDDRDSAILTTLLPTSYTAIVRGKDDSTGIALVEFYKLD